MDKANFNTILEEIKNVPLNRLEELHEYIKSLIPRKNKTNDKVSADWWDQISDDEKQLIQEGLKDIEDSRVISHEDFLKSFNR